MSRIAVAAIALTTIFPANGWASKITVKPGDTLSKISKDHKVSIKEIMRLNGLINSDQIKAGRKLQLKEEDTYPSIHKVSNGETIGKISRLYKVNKDDLIKINNLSHPDFLYPGQPLKIPSKGYTIHTVSTGDNIGTLSRLYKVKKNQIIASNNLTRPDFLYPGQKLKIPRESNHQKPGLKINPTPYSITVGKGETLSGISKKYRISVKRIIDLNNINEPNKIIPGAKLSLRSNKTQQRRFSTSVTNELSRKSEWRTYGPLKVDWTHWSLMGGSYVAPSLNNKGKPLYLAVNCSVQKINSTGENGVWKKWNLPLNNFEKQILFDLCKEKKL